MSSISSLSFHDFNLATRHVRIIDSDTIKNQVTKNTYIVDRMMEGRDFNSLTRQAGKAFTDYLQGQGSDTYGPYAPGQEENPKGDETDHEITVPYSFNRNYWVYDEEEVELNDGDNPTQRFYDLRKSKELNCLVGTLNGMEDQVWALPDKTAMETTSNSSNPRPPYSLLCFNTRNGEAPSSTNGGIASGTGDWDTVETLDPSAQTWWKNQTANYDPANPDDPDDGLINAFRQITLRAKFQMPTQFQRFTDPENTEMRRRVFVTSENGLTFYENRLRQVNDRMRILSDPDIGDAQFRGLPIMYISTLDGLGWTTDQPDYLLFDFNHIFPVFHPKWMLTQKITDGGSRQPNRYTVWKFIWWQLFCNSRRTQGRISAS